MKLKIKLAAVLGSVALLSGCMDKFSDINSDPSIIAKGNPTFLFTEQIRMFELQDYNLWFFDYKDMLQWGQVTVPTGGNSEQFNENVKNGGGANLFGAMKNALAIKDAISSIENSNRVAAASYNHLSAMSDVLLTFVAMQNMDMYGSMPYSEAYRARWGGTLTPKYDTQEELFESFFKTLDAAQKILLQESFVVGGQTVPLVDLSRQDLIYKGNTKKWAKLSNSLKLRLAARLYHVDKARAFAIVEEAAKSEAGFITEVDDTFIHSGGSEYYGSREDIYPGYGSKTTIDFFVENKDPRVRFFFSKNHFNSLVVQAYFDAQAADENQPNLPSYIADLVDYDMDGERKVFKGWKAPGEPWVRYHGLPSEIDAQNNEDYNDYFDQAGKILKIKLNGKEKRYTAASYMNLEFYRGNLGFTYPDAPDKSVTQDKTNRAFYSIHYPAGEADLYLAEFKLLGANISGSAADYFRRGITNSVKSWDKVASLNNIHYYNSVFDTKAEETISLKAGEIDELLTRDAYKLTGTPEEQLEKVYVQQRLNFTYMPLEMYVTMRRSGVPQVNSTILPLKSFKPGGTIADTPLPRRFSFADPALSDKMRYIKLNAWKDQGFSLGYKPSDLNTQRVWFDKNAPKFGEGPIVR